MKIVQKVEQMMSLLLLLLLLRKDDSGVKTGGVQIRYGDDDREIITAFSVGFSESYVHPS
jgi:hypothetical protein